MKLTIAAATLIAARSAQAACDSQMTIDVPGGIIGLTFVGYNVDESKIVRSTGSSNQIILKNFGAQPSYTVDPSHGVKVTAGESCGTGGGSGGSSAALAAFAGGLFTGNPLLAATSILFAGMPCAFAQDSCSNEIEVEIITTPTAKPPEGTNTCDGKKLELDNTACSVDGVVAVLGQAGADVSVGYQGGLNTTWEPITDPYYKVGLCPVNVHWHLGAEHRSEGEYDETFDANGPADSHRHLAEDARQGFRCKHYDASDAKFTTEYDWQHCVGMHVGETYEVHWPHSAVGACGTLNQYQTPFYDGVFCNIDAETFGTLTPENIKDAVGVQGQVFTIVNDEAYYYPDLMRGMIVDGEMGQEITKYTGSTTGTTRDNEICSQYAPITWQVDRKCHLISASTFDKMCADMKAQRDDMSDDLYAHGSRELVDDALASNNQQGNRELDNVEIVYGNFVY
ncbi:hypothetical protein ACHAWO_012129 [Cyclotella atomus]|uniref:Carbonic anhydrase n=1 Tax=Cyclotella atomus TaxID=382360 RepID=A0ABD3MP14_9STRA